jgi:hypothetical protein
VAKGVGPICADPRDCVVLRRPKGLAILERAVIGTILTHLGLDPQPPPRSKAREAGHEFAA